MRALSLRIRRQISLRPRLWLAGTLAVLLLAVGGGAYLLANSNKPVAPLPRPTTADRWTMSELVSHIEQGSVLFILPSEQIVLRAGETLCVPPNLPHSIECLEDCVALDIFCPVREDWVRGDDAYLRK